MNTAICPGCVRPVAREPQVCRHCGAAYHKACQDPVLGCVVAGCGPRRAARSGPYPWTRPWIGARFMGLLSVGTGAAALCAPNWMLQEYLTGGWAFAVHAFALCVWVGCIADASAGAIAGRRRGTQGLLWITSGLALMWVIALSMRRAAHLIQFTCGATYLIGTLSGFTGLFTDTYRARAGLAVLCGSALFLFTMAIR